jgi:hypothetical protein
MTDLKKRGGKSEPDPKRKRGGPGCLNRFSASISGVSPGLGCQAEWQLVEVGLIGCGAVKARLRSERGVPCVIFKSLLMSLFVRCDVAEMKRQRVPKV